MLCEADRRMTCEQLKAHPVRPFTLRLIGADGSSSTESIGLQSEISTLHSFHTLNPSPILRTSQLMRLIRRTIYLLELRMGMMQRRIWLSWVIRMSSFFLFFHNFFRKCCSLPKLPLCQCSRPPLNLPRLPHSSLIRPSKYRSREKSQDRADNLGSVVTKCFEILLATQTLHATTLFYDHACICLV
jgi:hypothetical protein